MSDPSTNPSPSRRRLRANRIWLTAVPPLASAFLASWLVPDRYALLAFLATGAASPAGLVVG